MSAGRLSIEILRELELLTDMKGNRGGEDGWQTTVLTRITTGDRKAVAVVGGMGQGVRYCKAPFITRFSQAEDAAQNKSQLLDDSRALLHPEDTPSRLFILDTSGHCCLEPHSQHPSCMRRGYDTVVPKSG